MRSLISSAIAFSASVDIQVYKDSNGIVYISGLTTGQFVQIAYGGLLNTIHAKPQDTCNFVKLPQPIFMELAKLAIYAPVLDAIPT